MSESYENRNRVRKPRPTSYQVEAGLSTTLLFLNNSFSKAIRTFPSRDNSAGKPLHVFQVRYSYLIDEIQRGPVYIVSKRIAEVNSLISEVTEYNNT